MVVARFREGESGTAADAGAPAEVPDDDDRVLCGQPGFELCAPGPMSTVPVVFALGKHCQFGHSFGMLGESPELGAWDTSKALSMEWHSGDVWQVSVLLPVSTPVAFKCVELGPDGSFMGWIQDIAAGGNMTVLAELREDYVSAYKVTVDPPMSADPAHRQPSLTARLDVVATLPLSAAFYARKKLAVAAGMPSADAEDWLTDQALAEQGLVSQDKLAQKWPEEIRSLKLVPESANETEFPSGALADAVAGGIMEAGDDEVMAASGNSSGSTRARPSTHQPSTAAGRMMSSVDWYEEGNSSSSANSTVEEEQQASSKYDTEADDEADWVSSGPPPAAVAASSTPPRHATPPAQYPDLHSPQLMRSAADLSTAGSSSDAQACTASNSARGLGASCVPPPSNTKLVSASPSVSSVDVDAPVGLPTKAVYEVLQGSLEPVDPIRVEQGIALPAQSQGDDASRVKGTTASSTEPAEKPQAPRVKITVDQPMSVNMRGEDPLSLPGPSEVAAMRGAQAPDGFVDSATEVGEGEGLLVPPDITAPKSVADVQTPSGAAHEARGWGSHEQLLAPNEQAHVTGLSSQAMGLEDLSAAEKTNSTLTGYAGMQKPAGTQHEEEQEEEEQHEVAPPEQAQSAGVTVQVKGLGAPTTTLSADEEQLAAALAAVAATASAVRYAGGAAAAKVIEAKQAIDARRKLDGPDATPVDHVMAGAGLIAAATETEAKFQGVQEGAEVLREAAREKMVQKQNPDQ